jgi:hypothetical protein
MITFPSIKEYRSAIHEVRERATYDGQDEAGNIKRKSVPLPTLRYQGTVKLHGTNTAVSRVNGQLIFQSRNNEITKEEDHFGFARFMSDREQAVHALIDAVLTATGKPQDSTIAIFGEWCGRGVIQRSEAAITKVDKKMFVMFKARVNDAWVDFSLTKGIEFPEHQIFNSQNFKTYELDIDFEHPYEARNLMVDITNEVERSCPVAAAFDSPGTGEGVVWSCIEPGWESSRFWFKVKGEKHSETHVRVLTPVEVEELRSIDEFVTATTTDMRLEKAVHHLVHELHKPLEVTSMADFIRYVYNDIVREEADTIAASGFDIKKLGSPIANKTRQWFFARLNSSL